MWTKIFEKEQSFAYLMIRFCLDFPLSISLETEEILCDKRHGASTKKLLKEIVDFIIFESWEKNHDFH